MQYFVSIEDCGFFRWQLGLLLQSMSDFGIQDSLVVACAEFDNSLPELVVPGLFRHENAGRNLGYIALNKPFGLAMALKKGLIKQPFVVIDPDTVMNRPVEAMDYCCAQYCSHLEYDILTSVGYEIEKDGWCPGGCLYHFNGADMRQLSRIFDIALEVKNRYENLPLKVDMWQREMVAFSILLSSVGAKTKTDMECSLYHSSDCNFIHYFNGFHPFFNKRVHNDLREFSMKPPCPLDSIKSMPNANRNVVRMKQVAKSLIANTLSFRP